LPVNFLLKKRSSLTKANFQVSNGYRGRFAPSPSGLLHFGSLIAALASFLDAKSRHGQWLVRIEDIDPPREQQGACKQILTTLDAYGLHWDEDILYQSKQTEFYSDVLSDLAQNKLTYYCQCTRAQIKTIGGIYQGTCKPLNLSHHNKAVRLINHQGINQFNDVIQGQVKCDTQLAKEDFILKRKDGLFAYQLAVVADDVFQNINHVIRGCDLLEPTARQLSLFSTFKQQPPVYGHVPVASATKGYKLSKQNKAPVINNNVPQPTLIKALAFLGQQPDTALHDASVEELIHWAITHWQRDNIAKVKEIVID